MIVQNLQNIILGITQGLTEFLPVSSSGHLYLLESYFGREPSLELSIILHGASLLAVLLYFWKDIIELIKECFEKKKPWKEKLSIKLIIATLITGVIGVPFQKIIADDLTPTLVAVTLLVTGALIIFAEKKRKTYSTDKAFSLSIAVLLGVIQAISILPGISRSGITISLLLIMGINRTESARISFLLSVPTIAGALAFLVLDTPDNFTLSSEITLAAMASFIAALAAIKWMMNLIKGKWIYFAPYCILLGAGILIFSML